MSVAAWITLLLLAGMGYALYRRAGAAPKPHPFAHLAPPPKEVVDGYVKVLDEAIAAAEALRNEIGSFDTLEHLLLALNSERDTALSNGILYTQGSYGFHRFIDGVAHQPVEFAFEKAMYAADRYVRDHFLRELPRDGNRK